MRRGRPRFLARPTAFETGAELSFHMPLRFVDFNLRDNARGDHVTGKINVQEEILLRVY